LDLDIGSVDIVVEQQLLFIDGGDTCKYSRHTNKGSGSGWYIWVHIVHFSRCLGIFIEDWRRLLGVRYLMVEVLTIISFLDVGYIPTSVSILLG
jgi:hypothetical protein